MLQSCEDVVDLTVSECVRHFAHFYPRPADPAEVIERVGLTAKQGSRIRSFRAASAGASTSPWGLSGGPELVFLDEPTTGFDPEARRQFWDVVRDLAREGTGHFVYEVSLPGSLERWWTFIWVTFLGATSMSLIGIAISSVPRSARSAAPVANLPLLVLEFISGVFVPFTSLSHTLFTIAGFFPLRWIVEGYQSALLPSYFQYVKPNNGWDHGEMASVLVIWCVIGLVLSARTFRWTGRGERSVAQHTKAAGLNPSPARATGRRKYRNGAPLRGSRSWSPYLPVRFGPERCG